MCTLSFITREDGYVLGMNRDERINRGPAEPPSETAEGGVRAIYPRDVEGGTWIGLNEYGVAFALLNWHGETAPGAAMRKTRTRGLVIPELLRYAAFEQVESAMQRFDLNGILPFRLIGIFPAEARIRDWTWDLGVVRSQDATWTNRQWFSSGRSQQQAELLRGGFSSQSWSEPGAGSIPWLRRLHASHANGPGPFSVCVHADGVQTVSYTEIECTHAVARLTYIPGSPCRAAEPITCDFKLAAFIDAKNALE